MKRRFAYDRWAEAFIAVCVSGDKARVYHLDGAEAASIKEGLAVLQAAAAVFAPRFHNGGGAAVAAKMCRELRAALEKCGYAAGGVANGANGANVAGGGANRGGANRAVETALNLFFLIVQKNCALHLESLCRRIDRQIKDLSGILEVVVESPGEPEPAFLAALQTALIGGGVAGGGAGANGLSAAPITGGVTGGVTGVEFVCRSRSELLGGYRLIIGSERLDFSVAGSLAALEKSFFLL